MTPDDFAGPVNIGNPGEFTIRELAELVLELTGSRSKLVFRPLPADDPRQRKPDIGLARQMLDWAPQVALRDGLTETIAYFRAVLKGEGPFVVLPPARNGAEAAPIASAALAAARRASRKTAAAALIAATPAELRNK